MRVLYKFGFHGLGDAVQWGCVLRHLKHYFPNQENFVEVKVDYRPLFQGVVDGFDRDCDSTVMVDWSECYTTYPDFPSTKAVAFLRDHVKVEPIKELLRYRLPSRLGREYVTVYLSRPHGYATIHYEGQTNPASKNLDRGIVDEIADSIAPIRTIGLGSVSLRTDPFEEKGILELVACMRQSKVNIAIDSGPQKIALALADEGGPPCVAIWTGHHPIHYCDYAKNTIHVIPINHETKVRGDWRVCRDFFEANYRYLVYHNVWELVDCVKQAVQELVK